MTAGKGARGVDGGRESPPESAGLPTAVKRWGRVGKVNKLVAAFECRANDQPANPTEESMVSSSPRRARKDAPFPSPVNVVDFNDAVQVKDSASPVDEKRFAFQGARNSKLKFGEETRQDEFKSQDQDKGSKEREDGQSINPHFAGSTSSGAAKNTNADGVENMRTIGASPVQRYVDRQTAAMKVEERNERQDHTIPRASKSVTLEFVKKIDRKHDYRTNGESKSAKANEKASSPSESDSKEKVAKQNERARSPRETLVQKEVAHRDAVTTENSGCTRGHVEPTADVQGQGGELSSSPIAVKDTSTCELAEAQSPSFEAALVNTKVGVVSGGQHDVAICGRLNLADHAQEYASKSVSKSLPDANQVTAEVEQYLDGGSKVAPGGLTTEDMNNIGIRRRGEASDFKSHVSTAPKAGNAAGTDEGTLPQEESECKIPEAEKMTPSSKGRKTRTDRTPKPVSSVASRKNDPKLQIVLDGFQKCKLINETLSQENQALKERLEMAESRTGALENEKTLAMKGIAEALQDRENMITTLEQRAGILSKEVKQTHDRYEAQIKFLRGENRSEVEKWKALHNKLEKQLRSTIQERTGKVRSLEETLQTKDALLKKLVDESEEAKMQHKNEIECLRKDSQRKQDALEQKLAGVFKDKEEIESELKDQLIGLEKSKREEINELQLSLNSESGAVKALESDLAIERRKTSTLQSDIKQAIDYFTVNLGQCQGAEQKTQLGTLSCDGQEAQDDFAGLLVAEEDIGESLVEAARAFKMYTNDIKASLTKAQNDVAHLFGHNMHMKESAQGADKLVREGLVGTGSDTERGSEVDRGLEVSDVHRDTVEVEVIDADEGKTEMHIAEIAVNGLRRAAESLDEELQTCRKDLQLAQQEVVRSSEQITIRGREIEQLAHENKSIVLSNVKLSEENMCLMRDLEDVTASLEESKLQEENSAVALEDRQASVESLQRRLEESLSRQAEVEEELEHHFVSMKESRMGDVEQLRMLLEKSEATVGILEDELVDQIRQVMGLKSEMRQGYDSMQRSFDLCNKELKKARKDCVRYTEIVAKQQREIDKLKNLKEENSKVVSENEMLSLENEVLKVNLDVAQTLLNESDASKWCTERETNLLREQCQSEMKNLMKDLEDVTVQKREIENDLHIQIESLEKSKQAAAVELDSLLEQTASKLAKDLNGRIHEVLKSMLKQRGLNFAAHLTQSSSNARSTLTNIFVKQGYEAVFPQIAEADEVPLLSHSDDHSSS